MYNYKGSNITLGPTFRCQSVSTIKPPFQIHPDISARLSKSPGSFHRLQGSRARKEQLKKQNMIHPAYE